MHSIYGRHSKRVLISREHSWILFWA
jgi:hypothetical protein